MVIWFLMASRRQEDIGSVLSLMPSPPPCDNHNQISVMLNQKRCRSMRRRRLKQKYDNSLPLQRVSLTFSVRAIPFEILRGAEWKKITDQPPFIFVFFRFSLTTHYIFYLFTDHPPHILIIKFFLVAPVHIRFIRAPPTYFFPFPPPSGFQME